MFSKESEQYRGQYQYELTKRLTQTSDLLSVVFPEEISRVWHVVSPKFRPPAISLRGRDISPQLGELANRTRDLFVSYHYWAGEYDGDDYCPPYHVWQIGPPRGITIIDRAVSQCTSDRNFQGLSMTLHCAQVKETMTPKELRQLIEDGYFNADLLFFFREGEIKYDSTKPESIFMDMISEDPLVNLEFTLWMLESLKEAEDIHPENVTFEIHKFWTNPRKP